MAFFSKAGNILRQASQKHINHEVAASTPSIFEMIRCMSSAKLYVQGLSYRTDHTSLREAFSCFGDVTKAVVVLDNETGRSRGYGFVTYDSPEGASAAVQGLNGQELDGRVIKIDYAIEKLKPRFGSGGGYGGGGEGY